MPISWNNRAREVLWGPSLRPAVALEPFRSLDSRGFQSTITFQAARAASPAFKQVQKVDERKGCLTSTSVSQQYHILHEGRLCCDTDRDRGGTAWKMHKEKASWRTTAGRCFLLFGQILRYTAHSWEQRAWSLPGNGFKKFSHPVWVLSRCPANGTVFSEGSSFWFTNSNN